MTSFSGQQREAGGVEPESSANLQPPPLRVRDAERSLVSASGSKAAEQQQIGESGAEEDKSAAIFRPCAAVVKVERRGSYTAPFGVFFLHAHAPFRVVASSKTAKEIREFDACFRKAVPDLHLPSIPSDDFLGTISSLVTLTRERKEDNIQYAEMRSAFQRWLDCVQDWIDEGGAIAHPKAVLMYFNFLGISEYVKTNELSVEISGPSLEFERLNQGVRLCEQGRYREALPLFEDLYTQASDTGESALASCIFLACSGAVNLLLSRYDEAMRRLQSAASMISADPCDATNELLLAILERMMAVTAMTRGDLEAAVDHGETSVEHAAKSANCLALADSHLLMAKILFVMGDAKACVQNAQTAHSLRAEAHDGPGTAEALFWIGRSYATVGAFYRARQYLDAASQRLSSSTASVSRMIERERASLAFDSGVLDEAFSAGSRWLSVDGTFEPRLFLARVSSSSGDPVGCIEFARAASICTGIGVEGRWQSQRLEARGLIDTHRPAQAHSLLSTLYQSRHDELGADSARMKNLEEALLWVSLANLEMSMGRRNDAIASATRAGTLLPSDAPVVCIIGTAKICALCGHSFLARSLCKAKHESLMVDQTLHRRELAWIAVFLAAMGDNFEMSDLLSAFERMEKDGDEVGCCAAALLIADLKLVNSSEVERDSVFEWFERALTFGIDTHFDFASAEAVLGLADVHRLQGGYAKAAVRYDMGAEMMSSFHLDNDSYRADALQCAGIAWFNVGDHERASLAMINPIHTPSSLCSNYIMLLYLGLCSFSLGEYRLACSQLKACMAAATNQIVKGVAARWFSASLRLSKDETQKSVDVINQAHALLESALQQQLREADRFCISWSLASAKEELALQSGDLKVALNAVEFARGLQRQCAQLRSTDVFRADTLVFQRLMFFCALRLADRHEYSEALPYFAVCGQEPWFQQAKSLYWTGHCHLEKGDAGAASQCFSRAIQCIDADDELILLGRCRLGLVDVAWLRHDLGSASLELARARQISNMVVATDLKVAVATYEAKLFSLCGYLDKAVDAAEEAAAWSAKGGEVLNAIEAHCLACASATKLGDMEKAVAAANSAMEIAQVAARDGVGSERRQGRRSLASVVARVSHNLGVLHAVGSEPSQAMSAFAVSADAAVGGEDGGDIALTSCLIRAGDVSMQCSDNETALVRFQEALQVISLRSDRHVDDDLALALNNMAAVLIKSGNPRSACEHFERAAEVLIKGGNFGGAAQCYERLAEAHLSVGETESSLNSYREALNYLSKSESSQTSTRQGLFLMQICNLSILCGDAWCAGLNFCAWCNQLCHDTHHATHFNSNTDAKCQFLFCSWSLLAKTVHVFSQQGPLFSPISCALEFFLGVLNSEKASLASRNNRPFDDCLAMCEAFLVADIYRAIRYANKAKTSVDDETTSAWISVVLSLSYCSLHQFDLARKVSLSALRTAKGAALRACNLALAIASCEMGHLDEPVQALEHAGLQNAVKVLAYGKVGGISVASVKNCLHALKHCIACGENFFCEALASAALAGVSNNRERARLLIIAGDAAARCRYPFQPWKQWAPAGSIAPFTKACASCMRPYSEQSSNLVIVKGVPGLERACGWLESAHASVNMLEKKAWEGQNDAELRVDVYMAMGIYMLEIGNIASASPLLTRARELMCEGVKIRSLDEIALYIASSRALLEEGDVPAALDCAKKGVQASTKWGSNREWSIIVAAEVSALLQLGSVYSATMELDQAEAAFNKAHEIAVLCRQAEPLSLQQDPNILKLHESRYLCIQHDAGGRLTWGNVNCEADSLIPGAFPIGYTDTYAAAAGLARLRLAEVASRRGDTENALNLLVGEQSGAQKHKELTFKGVTCVAKCSTSMIAASGLSAAARIASVSSDSTSMVRWSAMAADSARRSGDAIAIICSNRNYPTSHSLHIVGNAAVMAHAVTCVAHEDETVPFENVKLLVKLSGSICGLCTLYGSSCRRSAFGCLSSEAAVNAKAMMELASSVDRRLEIYFNALECMCLAQCTSLSASGTIRPSLMSLATHLLSASRMRMDSLLPVRVGPTVALALLPNVEDATIAAEAARRSAASTGYVNGQALCNAFVRLVRIWFSGDMACRSAELLEFQDDVHRSPRPGLTCQYIGMVAVALSKSVLNGVVAHTILNMFRTYNAQSVQQNDSGWPGLSHASSAELVSYLGAMYGAETRWRDAALARVSDGNATAAIHCEWARATVSARNRCWEEASSAVGSVLELATRCLDLTNRVAALTALGDLAIRLKDMPGATSYFLECVGLTNETESLDLLVYRARCFDGLGRVAYAERRPKQARKYFATAKLLRRRLNGYDRETMVGRHTRRLERWKLAAAAFVASILS